MEITLQEASPQIQRNRKVSCFLAGAALFFSAGTIGLIGGTFAEKNFKRVRLLQYSAVSCLMISAIFFSVFVRRSHS